jgi:hypothetical protein
MIREQSDRERTNNTSLNLINVCEIPMWNSSEQSLYTLKMKEQKV